MRFEGIDGNFVVKMLYEQLSLDRVGESHAIRMMISNICLYVFSSLYGSPIVKMFLSERFAYFIADYIWRDTSHTNEL